MDPLALLCNLHADGPTTLRRLQQLGVHTLDALPDLPVDALGEALGCDAPVAERFQREANLLLVRTAGKSSSPSAGSNAASQPDEEILSMLPGRVKRRSPVTLIPHSRRRRKYQLHPRMHGVTDPLAVQLPTSQPGRRSAVLREGLLDGLDGRFVDALQRAGIRTAEALARASSIDLATDLEVPYDRVYHVQRQAVQFLGWHEAGAPPAPEPRSLPTRPTPGVEPGDDGGSAGGPFA